MTHHMMTRSKTRAAAEIRQQFHYISYLCRCLESDANKAADGLLKHKSDLKLHLDCLAYYVNRIV
jgi:hypothetical protein